MLQEKAMIFPIKKTQRKSYKEDEAPRTGVQILTKFDKATAIFA